MPLLQTAWERHVSESRQQWQDQQAVKIANLKTEHAAALLVKDRLQPMARYKADFLKSVMARRQTAHQSQMDTYTALLKKHEEARRIHEETLEKERRAQLEREAELKRQQDAIEQEQRRAYEAQLAKEAEEAAEAEAAAERAKQEQGFYLSLRYVFNFGRGKGSGNFRQVPSAHPRGVPSARCR